MNDVAEIIEKSRDNAIARKVEEHDRQIELMSSTLTNVNTIVVDIRDALMGTMKTKGIISEHRDNTEFIAACRERHENDFKEIKENAIDWRRWVERGCIAGFSGGAISLIGWLMMR